jgi:hypothetical protein
VSHWLAPIQCVAQCPGLDGAEHRGDGALPRIFYRSVKTNPPTVDDFRSHAARGRPCPSNEPTLVHEWEGLSVFTTYEQARANAAKWKWRIGEYVAEVSTPDDLPITVEGPDSRGHANLYDIEAQALLRCVTRVVHGPSTELLPRARR